MVFGVDPRKRTASLTSMAKQNRRPGAIKSQQSKRPQQSKKAQQAKSSKVIKKARGSSNTKRNVAIIVVIGLVAAATGLVILLSSGGESAKTVTKGSVAPPLVGKNVIDGQPFNLQSDRGKPTLVTFWGSACQHCLATMPQIEQLYKQFGSQYNFVSVGTGQKIQAPPPFDSPDSFIKHTRITLPTVLNTKDNKFGKAWDVKNLPKFYILDKDLKVSDIVTGEVPPSALLPKLQAAGS